MLEVLGGDGAGVAERGGGQGVVGIRYVELTDAAAAVIVSRNGKVDYCFMSDPMKSLRFDAWPRKGSPIPAGTATASVARLPPEQGVIARFVRRITLRAALGVER